ncbi:zinc finger CCCH domain-containing protein 55-like [Actinidia eriantha]|uniref:zinc finger CCCH domain-containing protein 55-like n=1 Tax=Actinidia eriantha TaxID=165200 RepID=UPI00258C01D2|nr:zinc finger CCCH domain-containing protein 55-like [Actinidia eriantha]XP_057504939.1 zinc finger CCCH domain-containing protein 55-like [Actinidia eriantha]XP_057504940.1 zinc finger CCCH domain-containing protein 55-like [Actinidia eriantha]XP_057504941.1 zinc finger CCCH domain-containing protein 55-like [Actinidia eriantha]
MMSGSARKRKSMWDSKEESKLPVQISEKDAWHEKESYSNRHVSHDSRLSDEEDFNALKSKDFSGRSSWEPSQGNSIQKDNRRDLNDIHETRKAWDGDKSYHASSDFDGWGQQNKSRSSENSRSQSYRYRRSRSPRKSRSRSIGRGRGSSRSPSRGRRRSRSRDRDRGRGRSRSRSPVGDYQQESYRWNDRRRSGSGVPSHPCRDFTAGKCTRGSQCRFLHEDNINHRDGGCLEKERAVRWRSTQEHGGNYYGGEKDEPQRNSGKYTVLCNNFLKGRCLGGSSCRYSHHDDSGDNCERSNRNSSDRDYQPPPRNGNPPCKYFMMGKCSRDNCRFSHNGPARGHPEGKSQGDNGGNDSGDMNNSWNGPKWDEVTAVSIVEQSTDWGNIEKGTSIDPTISEKQIDYGWGHSLEDNTKEWNGSTWADATGFSESGNSTGWGSNKVENVNLSDWAHAERRTDGGCDHSLDNESRMWGGPVGKAKAVERDENACPHLGSGGDVVDMCITESEDVARSFGREPLLTPLGLQSQALYGISKNVHEQNIMQEAFPEKSLIQQHHNKMGGDNAITNDLNSVSEVDVYGNAGHPSLVRGHIFNLNADSFGSRTQSAGGINQSQHMISVNHSNGHDIDLNGPAQQNNSSSNLQNQMQNQHGESVKTMVNCAMPQDVANSEQAAQLTNFPASLMQIFGNGQLPQLYAALNPQTSVDSVLSLPHSASLPPPITSMDAQLDPAAMSQKQYDPIADSVDINKPGNGTQPPKFLPDSVEQKNQMVLVRSSPPSAVGFDSGELPENGGTENNNRRSPDLKQQKAVANLVPEESSKSIPEKWKQEQESICARIVDANTKIVDGTIGKDEKAMRLFKNALVDFVKELLKPKWKEGQMSREVHKAIVKKVVDKVTSTIQVANIPKTQERIDQYLAYSKPKLNKLVEAYTQRFAKSS